MIVLSPEYKALHSKLYLLSFSVIALQFLPIKSIKVVEIEIDEENKFILAGAFTFVLILLLLAAICYIMRDFFFTKIEDNQALIQDTGIRDINFSDSSSVTQKPLEKHAGLYVFWSQLAFVVEGLAPLLMGILSVYASRGSLIQFVQNVVSGG